MLLGARSVQVETLNADDSIAQPRDLGDLLKLLKTHGVARFSGGGISVEFSPASTPEPQAAPVIEEEKCRCGHAVHQHNEMGQCLIGCGLEKCAAPEK